MKHMFGVLVNVLQELLEIMIPINVLIVLILNVRIVKLVMICVLDVLKDSTLVKTK